MSAEGEGQVPWPAEFCCCPELCPVLSASPSHRLPADVPPGTRGCQRARARLDKQMAWIPGRTPERNFQNREHAPERSFHVVTLVTQMGILWKGSLLCVSACWARHHPLPALYL